MTRPTILSLGKRQRQIYETVYRLKCASVAEVLAGLDQPPSYSTVRAILNRLVQQGWLLSQQDGQRLTYQCAEKRSATKRSIAKQVLQNFFQGSPAEALTAFLDASERPLTDEEVNQMTRQIENARSAASKERSSNRRVES